MKEHSYTAYAPRRLSEVDPMEIKKTILAAKNFCVQGRLDDFFHGDNLSLTMHREEMTRSVCLRLHAMIYGREVKRVDFEYPASWWDHFKQRWFPAWALKKWPVVMEKKTILAEEFYPMLSAPSHNPQIVLTSL